MEDLNKRLASLRLDDEPPRSRRRAWLVIALPVFMVAAGMISWWGHGVFAATKVETTMPRVESSEGAASGMPLLTASGYVVARRKAVVSAKIQGRLTDLRVEEGARVQEGEVIARLESQDYEAQVWRAQAQVQQAEAQIAGGRAAIRRAQADLAEARRQLGLNERLAHEHILAADTLEASRARVRVLEAAVGQVQADVKRMEAARTQALADQRLAEAELANTIIRAPFTGVIVKKMAEVGESVAPIPPGVNLSTSSGAIVALADLDTLELEVDVAEANVAKLSPSHRGSHRRSVPREAIQGRAAADPPDRGPHQSDGHRKGDDPRSRPEPETGDERQGDISRADFSAHRDQRGAGPAADPGPCAGGGY